MKNILISGLVNTETTVRVRRFPIEYYPIDYPFFGVSTSVSGVAYNIARALRTLGDRVSLISMTGKIFPLRISGTSWAPAASPQTTSQTNFSKRPAP